MSAHPPIDVPAAGGEPPVTGPAGTGATADGRSLGDLVGDIANDLTTLVKQEVELAKTELRTEAKRAGKGAGLLGGAGVAGHLAVLFASLALVYLLDTWMHAAWAALIVAALWAAGAALMAARGRKELTTMNPGLPTTQRTLEEDAEWARQLKNG